jgi:methylmalonyl-CoA/ethylmalonyl-CoA epimerase
MNIKLNHIGIAVRNLEQSLEKWKKLFSVKEHNIEDIKDRGVRLVQLDLEGGASVELIEAIGEESPIKRFLEKNGEGIHHFCFEVNDINKAMKELREKGIKFVDGKPKKGGEGSLIAFIHPNNINGVLIELKEKRD